MRTVELDWEEDARMDSEDQWDSLQYITPEMADKYWIIYRM
jgi:hypothetical protein